MKFRTECWQRARKPKTEILFPLHSYFTYWYSSTTLSSFSFYNLMFAHAIFFQYSSTYCFLGNTSKWGYEGRKRNTVRFSKIHTINVPSQMRNVTLLWKGDWISTSPAPVCKARSHTVEVCLLVTHSRDKVDFINFSATYKTFCPKKFPDVVKKWLEAKSFQRKRIQI